MKRILFTLFILVFLLSACETKGAATEKAPATLNITDPAKPIEVNAGDEFQITIESNPTTGYHWEIIGNPTALQFVSKDYTSTSVPGLVGGGGIDTWTFKAISPGNTQISLGYYPPSNLPTDPQQKITFIVRVK